MHSIVPLRADGTVAYNCIVWADTRSQRQAEYLETATRSRLWNPAIALTASPRSCGCAVMGGVAFGIRLCTEALIKSGSLEDKNILITGGVPKSPLMRKILSNVLPARVTFRSFSDMSALGALAHAAVAVGISEHAAAFLDGFDYGESTPASEPALQEQYELTYNRFKEWADRIAAG